MRYSDSDTIAFAGDDVAGLTVSIYMPHIYQGLPFAQGRYGVEIIIDANSHLRRYLPYSYGGRDTLADYWAVVDDFGNLVRVQDRFAR